MTNDITTLNGALMELGELMATNLSNKGVEADAEDGLTTLATKILDVTPFITGVDLSTTLTLDTLYTVNIIHKPINFNTQLKCFFDDLSEADIDLSGFLQGAPINFYSNNNLIGTSITNENGEALFSFIPTTTGVFFLYIEFEGNNNYSMSRSAKFTLIIVNEIHITSSKNIVTNEENFIVTVTIPDDDGEGNNENQTVLLSNEVDSTNWNIDLTQSDNIGQSEDIIDFIAEVTDENGNLVENTVVNIYREVPPSTEMAITEILFYLAKNIITKNENITITTIVPDIEGEGTNINRPVLLINNIDSTNWNNTLSTSKNIGQNGETIDFITEITDENGNPMENIVINIYKEEE